MEVWSFELDVSSYMVRVLSIECGKGSAGVEKKRGTGYIKGESPGGKSL
jgi:hypothetical protein